MVVKQTRRSDFTTYDGRAEELYATMGTKLDELVNKAAAFEYNGERAKRFKDQCVAHSKDFSEQVNTSCEAVGTVVNQHATFIATNLGGAIIDLTPPVMNVGDPAIVCDLTVETADSAGLEDLRATADSVYDQMSQLWNDHLDAFVQLGTSGGWIGPEYDETLDGIQGVTTNAIGVVEAAKADMNKAIDAQLEDLHM